MKGSVSKPIPRTPTHHLTTDYIIANIKDNEAFCVPQDINPENTFKQCETAALTTIEPQSYITAFTEIYQSMYSDETTPGTFRIQSNVVSNADFVPTKFSLEREAQKINVIEATNNSRRFKGFRPIMKNSMKDPDGTANNLLLIWKQHKQSKPKQSAGFVRKYLNFQHSSELFNQLSRLGITPHLRDQETAQELKGFDRPQIIVSSQLHVKTLSTTDAGFCIADQLYSGTRLWVIYNRSMQKPIDQKIQEYAKKYGSNFLHESCSYFNLHQAIEPNLRWLNQEICSVPKYCLQSQGDVVFIGPGVHFMILSVGRMNSSMRVNFCLPERKFIKNISQQVYGFDQKKACSKCVSSSIVAMMKRHSIIIPAISKFQRDDTKPIHHCMNSGLQTGFTTEIVTHNKEVEILSLIDNVHNLSLNDHNNETNDMFEDEKDDFKEAITEEKAQDFSMQPQSNLFEWSNQCFSQDMDLF